jgi:uncharacterized membrane protein
MKNPKSDISKKPYPKNELISGESLSPNIIAEIKKDHPEFNEDQYLGLNELNYYRQRYIESTLKEEIGSLTSLEQDVLDSIKKGEFVSEDIEEDLDRNLTFGERLADRIAEFGGSWSFILIFLSFIVLWMLVNIYVLIRKPFDPYPFILLNLILSCLAAIQAPIIIMSQNRQEDRDRERAKHDYKVNLKAELEIRLLHEKIDHLILNQQQKVMQIQEIQTEMMKDIMNVISHKPPPLDKGSKSTA